MKMVKGATTAVLLGCALFFFTQPLHAEVGFMPLPAQANELNIAPYCARAGCLYFALPSIIPNFAIAKFAPKGLRDKIRRGFCRFCKVIPDFSCTNLCSRKIWVSIYRLISDIWPIPQSRPNSRRIWPCGHSLSLVADFSIEKSGIIYNALEIRILHILNTGLPIVEFGLDTVILSSINNIKQIEQSI